MKLLTNHFLPPLLVDCLDCLDEKDAFGLVVELKPWMPLLQADVVLFTPFVWISLFLASLAVRDPFWKF